MPLLVNIRAIYFNCYNAADFSIYQQAIYDILTLRDANPFVSIRNIHIFNDHFDPIIYLAVVFTILFGQGFQQLLVFEWLFYAAVIFSVVYIFRSNIEKAIGYLFCLVLTKLFLFGLLYPIHPTTWACLPFFWLTYFIVKKKPLHIALTVPILCLFKESYAFAVFPLGVFYLFRKEYKLGASVCSVALFFILFELFFREALLGPIHGHGDGLLEPMIHRPIKFLMDIVADFNAMQFLKMFYPFFFCFLFYIKYEQKRKMVFINSTLPVSLFFFPLLFLQIVRNDIHHHYGPQFGGILFGLMVSLDMLRAFSKKMFMLLIVVFASSSMGTYTRMFKGLFSSDPFHGKCRVYSGKIEENSIIKSKIEEISRSKVILATGGIIPFIMVGGKAIDHYRSYSSVKKSYHYLLLERNGSGDSYPASFEEVQRVIDSCRELSEDIYIDNEHIFFAKGKFDNCVY